MIDATHPLWHLIEDADYLVAGERFGVIRDEMIRRGFKAISCDMDEDESPDGGPHVVCDWRNLIPVKHWRGIIIHPTCTKVCVSGNHVYGAGKPRHQERLDAAAEIESDWEMVKAHADSAALENPMGVLPSLTGMGKPDLMVQPYEHGDDASKRTCFWLHGEWKPFGPTKLVDPRWVCCGREVPDELGKYGCPNCCGTKRALPRWDNQTNSGQNRLGPTKDPKDRAMARSATYPGIARAVVKHWLEETDAADN